MPDLLVDRFRLDGLFDGWHRGVNIHASLPKRGAPVLWLVARDLFGEAPRARFPGLRPLPPDGAEHPHDVVDLKAVEHELGFAELTTLLEIAPQ
ncbi:MAG TPA: hypothetical protein VGN73_12315 [Gemmatimonadaceae bacterium]|nr:hypothetical protein [Gemmatimonadaceae bacterium]